jgi:hypothetical protein
VKRAWTNPKRWFGDSYRIDYEFEPGQRHVTAVVLIPKGVDTISISVLPQDELVQVADVLRTSQEFTIAKFNTANAAFENWRADPNNPVISSNRMPGYSKWMLDTSLLAAATGLHRDSTNEPENRQTEQERIEAARIALEKQVVYAQTSSTLVIETTSPVSSETRAYVGPVAVPVSKTDVLGRYRLVLTVDKNKSLEGRLTAELARFKSEQEVYKADQQSVEKTVEKAKPPTIPVRIVTPGALIENFTVRLAAAPGETPKPFVTLSEKAAGAGTTIELTFNTVALKDIQEIRFGSYVIPGLVKAQMSEIGKDPKKLQVISFVIPAAPKQASGPVSIETDDTGADAKKRTHTEKNVFQYTL